MGNYYFLGTRLPALSFDVPAEITFYEFDTLIKDNLSHHDYAKTLIFRRYHDILNIRAYWEGDELNPDGSMDFNQIEEALIAQYGFPDYVYDYLATYEKKEERLKYFPQLIMTFFREESKHAKGFLRKLLLLEREWRLVMLGFRAKKLGRNLEEELQFENPEDPLVQQILAQKEAKNYEPPDEYAELKGIFEKYQDEPLNLHRALSEYRFHKIEEMLGFDTFSIDRILGYLAQLIIVEKWQRLNHQKGIEIVDTIIKEAT